MTSSEKQGYLTDLHIKSKPELQELLERQEKLVANVTFVKRLPDKGAKIHAMIDKIKATMKHVENVDETADLFEKMAIQSERARQQRLGWDGMEMDEQDEELLRRIANKGQIEKKIVVEETTPDGKSKFINSYEKVIKNAEQRSTKAKFKPNRTIRTKDVQSLSHQISLVSLQTKRDVVSLSEPSGNDVSLKKQTVTSGDGDVKQTAIDQLKARLSAENTDNSELHSNENDDKTDKSDHSILENSTKMSTSSNDADNLSKSKSTSPECNKLCTVLEKSSTSQTLPGVSGNVGPSKPLSNVSTQSAQFGKSLEDHADARGKLKYQYDELLETSLYTGKCHHQGAKMISVEESAKLQSSQQKTVQELQVKSAAEKLAGRLHVKMDTYHPDGRSNISYREQQTASDGDHDSDDDEMDYPD